MTLVVLIRHAHSSANAAGILSGRIADIHLSTQGKKQAKKLATRLGDFEVKSVRISPMIRCAETIEPWATGNGSKVVIDQGVNEMDYGTWSGRTLKTLSKETLWKTIQENPSKVTFPQGESMRAMQVRAMKSVTESAAKRGKGHVVIVSHGDVIKAIIASCLGMALDDFQRIVIDPASISIVDLSNARPRLLVMNNSSNSINEILASKHSKRLLVGGGEGLKKVNGRK
ncbi:MAG: MSMEG_4193 family putative phosphomutase [Streptomycetaceae bacterium]|nr:MAG: MSMEG_4193 family putative phosphomutase [Streptomycetaceae bacterium]